MTKVDNSVICSVMLSCGPRCNVGMSIVHVERAVFVITERQYIRGHLRHRGNIAHRENYCDYVYIVLICS